MSIKARAIPTTIPAIAPPLIPEFDDKDVDPSAPAEDLAESKSLGIKVTVWKPPTLVTTDITGVASVEEGAVAGSEDLGAICK